MIGRRLRESCIILNGVRVGSMFLRTKRVWLDRSCVPLQLLIVNPSKVRRIQTRLVRGSFTGDPYSRILPFCKLVLTVLVPRVHQVRLPAWAPSTLRVGCRESSSSQLSPARADTVQAIKACRLGCFTSGNRLSTCWEAMIAPRQPMHPLDHQRIQEGEEVQGG